MMKKYLCLLMSACLLIPLLGCAGKSPASTMDVNFYYTDAQLRFGDGESFFKTEIWKVENDPLVLENMIRTYLTGPATGSYVNPFPKGTALLSLEVQQDNITLILGGSYTTLSPFKKSVACACLTMTLCPVANVPQLTVLAENDPANSEKGIVMRPEDLIFMDTSKIPIEENQS